MNVRFFPNIFWITKLNNDNYSNHQINNNKQQQQVRLIWIYHNNNNHHHKCYVKQPKLFRNSSDLILHRLFRVIQKPSDNQQTRNSIIYSQQNNHSGDVRFIFQEKMNIRKKTERRSFIFVHNKSFPFLSILNCWIWLTDCTFILFGNIQNINQSMNCSYTEYNEKTDIQHLI